MPSCVCVAKDLANCWTDMVLLYSEALIQLHGRFISILGKGTFNIYSCSKTHFVRLVRLMIIFHALLLMDVVILVMLFVQQTIYFSGDFLMSLCCAKKPLSPHFINTLKIKGWQFFECLFITFGQVRLDYIGYWVAPQGYGGGISA